MSWNRKKLLVSHGLLAALLLSYLLPYPRSLWNTIDDGFFRILNGSLEGNPIWQLFWALANHKLADWVHDVVILMLTLAAIFSVRKEDRVKKTAEFLFSYIYIACILFFINRLIFRNTLRFEHLSPTIVHTDCIKLSKEISWLGIKDSSNQSFPGDHATTALLFAASYTYYANRKLSIFGWLYGVFMCLPRIIIGAHWFSDVVIGSGSIALFFLSWAFYSPFGGKITYWITCLLQLHKRQTA